MVAYPSITLSATFIAGVAQLVISALAVIQELRTRADNEPKRTPLD
jgi:anaerobic C4-dicarboxylate transporter